MIMCHVKDLTRQIIIFVYCVLLLCCATTIDLDNEDSDSGNSGYQFSTPKGLCYNVYATAAGTLEGPEHCCTGQKICVEEPGYGPCLSNQWNCGSFAAFSIYLLNLMLVSGAQVQLDCQRMVQFVHEDFLLKHYYIGSEGCVVCSESEADGLG
jgi:hypothetical protein